MPQSNMPRGNLYYFRKKFYAPLHYSFLGGQYSGSMHSVFPHFGHFHSRSSLIIAAPHLAHFLASSSLIRNPSCSVPLDTYDSKLAYPRKLRARRSYAFCFLKSRTRAFDINCTWCVREFPSTLRTFAIMTFNYLIGWLQLFSLIENSTTAFTMDL